MPLSEDSLVSLKYIVVGRVHDLVTDEMYLRKYLAAIRSGKIVY